MIAVVKGCLISSDGRSEKSGPLMWPRPEARIMKSEMSAEETPAIIGVKCMLRVGVDVDVTD